MQEKRNIANPTRIIRAIRDVERFAIIAISNFLMLRIMQQNA